MDLTSQIRDLIVSYSSESMDLSQFRDKFVPLLATSNVSDQDGFKLAFNVESVYAEYIGEIIDEKELRFRLSHLVPLGKNCYAFGFRKSTGNDSTELRSGVGSSAFQSACV